MMNEATSYDPPYIEQILDTVVNKDNKRFYKVKWVKISWEEESDLAYFSNIINQFWRKYIPENVPLSVVDSSSITAILSDTAKTTHSHDEGLESHNNDLTTCSQPDSVLSNALVSSDDLYTLTAVAEYSSNMKDSLSPGKDDILEKTNLIEKTNDSEKSLDHKCKSCNKVFKKAATLTKHEMTHYSKQCPICGKECTRIGHLKTHMLTHSSIRPWTCDVCKKSFVDKSTLTKHKLVHTKVRAHVCGVCDEKFLRAEHLRRHKEAKHEKVKNFQCDVCKKEFHQKSSLKVHLNIHTGEKPYICSICLKAFSDNSTLTRHVKTHNKIENLTCKFCQKALSSKLLLEKHVCKMGHHPLLSSPVTSSTIT